MAMYEENGSAVTNALKTSSSEVFSDNTIKTILDLSSTAGKVSIDSVAANSASPKVVFAGGTTLGFLTSDAPNTAVVLDGAVKSVILGGTGGFNVTVGVSGNPVTAGQGAQGAAAPASAEGVVDHVLIHSAGADKITVADGTNNLLVVGNKDTVIAGTGYDTVVASQGHSTIVGGTSGHTVVEAAGKEADYAVTVVNGHAVVTNNTNGIGFDASKLQYVKVDDGALIFAENSKEAAIATLYETVFGRAADAHGLEFWFNKAEAGLSVKAIAQAFLNSAEFKALPVADDAAFLQSLYQHTFNRAADATGLAFWTDALAHGVSRATVIEGFVNAAAENLSGTSHTETVLVGSITIVDGIV